MKKVNLFIIKSFIGPFVVTFTIAMLFLIMQFLWKYIDDIMGKDVGMFIVFKLLFYTSANIIPMALPIAILFSSIMTMGNLAESNELTAMKSAGMSLLKIMRPMLIFVFMLSAITFYFSNYILPIANLKQRTLIYDLQSKKPTLSIPVGKFYNDIKGLAIKADGKDKETGELYGVLIYMGNPTKIIRAEKGEMLSTTDNENLFLKLTDGSMYEESKMTFDKDSKYSFNKSFFRESIVRFDLSAFNLNNSDEEIFKRDYEMMNFLQLGKEIDTLNHISDSLTLNYKIKIKQDLFVFNTSIPVNEDIIDSVVKAVSIADLSDQEYISALKSAQINIRSRKDFSNIHARQMENRAEIIIEFKTAWHQKFTLSFAIIVLFFIGAPLGAIVRKGGLGTPLVLATLLFLFYYIITIVGENLVESNIFSPLNGMWLSAYFLVPIGLFLSYKSANEAAMFDIEVYKKLLDKMIKKRSE